MATIKEQDIVLVSKEPDGTKVIQMPITRVENVEGGVATVNGVKPDTSKNVVLNEVNKAKEATHAVNADNATKATQDANGKVISTTYATKAEVSKKQDSATAFTKAAADNLYLGKTDTAVNATKALQDHTGNNIVETYATKSNTSAELAKKADTTYVNTELAKKADTTKVNSDLNSKLNTVELENILKELIVEFGGRVP